MSVHPTRFGTWEVRYRDEGGRNRSKSFKQKTAAKKFDREKQTEKDKGTLIDPDKAAMKFADFYEKVFVPTKQVANSTKKLWGRLWGRKDPKADCAYHLRKKWGHLKLRDVNNREAVLAWHDEMSRDGASDAKVFQAHGLLVSIITHAVELEYLNRSRVSGIQPDYEPQDTGEPWLPEDIEAIRSDLFRRAENPPQGYGGQLRDLHRWRRQRDAVAVGVMGYAAPRIGECFAFQWPMLLVRGDDGKLRIRKHVEITSRVPNADGDPENRTKTSRTRRTPRAMRKPRIVELEEALGQDLRWWWMVNGQPKTGYVFPVEPGGDCFERTMFASWTRSVFNKSVEAAGLVRYLPKHPRMSCVSMWIRERRDEGTVADMAGHSVAVMWQTYRKAFLARMRPTSRSTGAPPSRGHVRSPGAMFGLCSDRPPQRLSSSPEQPANRGFPEPAHSY